MKNRKVLWIFFITLFLSGVAHSKDLESVVGSKVQPVYIQEDSVSYILSNGIIKAVVSKKSGCLTSLVYEGKEVLAGRGEQATALWSHDASSPEMIRKITIDPSKNNGALAEVSVKGISGGRPMGNGPGGSFIADIEIRFALAQGESGIYTYCVFDHGDTYPASSMGEARFVAFLDQGFDWISIDDKRNYSYPLKKGGLDLSKYTLTANQTENPAFGWINTTDKIGFWLVNPSVEYMSGGPTKVDFLCHRDTRIDGAPCALNYWRSSHYGGSSVDVANNEKWTKVIGPFMIYMNKGTTPEGIRQNAREQAVSEHNKWPYAWVNYPAYPLESVRGTVSGKIILKDLLTPATFTRLRVGLTAPDYTITQAGATRVVDWQYDTKFYQFWVEGNAKGEFIIPDIRPGKYTLHAIADGVLGEYSKTDITVQAGQKINLENLEWVPVRYGKQLWDIGLSNRNASEFLCGDRWFETNIFKEYPHYFPTDVNYTIGKSNFKTDWFYIQPPHVSNPQAAENNVIPEVMRQALIKALGTNSLPETEKQTSLKVIDDLGTSGKYAQGSATPWKINFTLQEILNGEAVLRVAICGTSAKEIGISVNDKPVGKFENLRLDGAPSKSGFTGMWYERQITFDAALLNMGNNSISLTVPEGQADAAVMYDYIRLEYRTNN